MDSKLLTRRLHFKYGKRGGTKSTGARRISSFCHVFMAVMKGNESNCEGQDTGGKKAQEPRKGKMKEKNN